MKKKLVLILATLMCISLCACGGTESTSGNNTDTSTKKEESGFTPNQVTETEKEELLEIDENNLEQYYDTTQFVGTPTLVYCLAQRNQVENIIVIGRMGDDGNYYEYTIEYNDKIKSRGYDMIFVDNNTPNDYSDDLIAYIFVN